MKKYFLSLAAVFIIIAVSCEEKIDIVKETAAVKAVINGETEAFINRDSAKVFGYYLKDEAQTRVQVSRDTFYINKGWKDLHSRFQEVDWSAKTPGYKFAKEFIEVKIMEESAWAVYKETHTIEADGVVTKYNLLLTMVLQKEEEDWKISCFTIYDITPKAPAPAEEAKK